MATIDGQDEVQGIEVRRFAHLDLRNVHVTRTIAYADEQTRSISPGCITGGGAINICGGADVSISNCKFSEGTAAFKDLEDPAITSNGGLISNAGILTVVDTEFELANADFGYGGCLYTASNDVEGLYPAPVANVTGSTFHRCQSGGGGAVATFSDLVVLRDVRMTQCYAFVFTTSSPTQDGGAVLQQGGRLVLEGGCVIEDCSALGDGGAIACISTSEMSLHIEDTNITRCGGHFVA
eukprot:2385890-Pleurochrysis_carterae.AAC.3